MNKRQEDIIHPMKSTKTILTEGISLVDVYDALLESRGVIDGIDEMISQVTNGINAQLKRGDLEGKRIGKENVTKYEMSFICKSSDMDTSFMLDPQFDIDVFMMDNRFGDALRPLGDNYYESPMVPNVEYMNGEPKLTNPSFHMFFVVPKGGEVPIFDVGSKMSHEIVHARKNFEEFISASNRRHGARGRDEYTIDLMSYEDKQSLRYLIGRVLYLCSRDEINARSNQLYYELKKFNRLSRRNVNYLVKETNIYKFVEEMEEKIGIIEKLNDAKDLNVYDEARRLLNGVYGENSAEVRNPFTFLENLLRKRKNDFIRQIDKVKERALYEKLNETIRMPL